MAGLYTVFLPTPLTDAKEQPAEAFQPSDMCVFAFESRQLERDCMTLALRLIDEDADTFAPETREVMARWQPRVKALLKSGRP